ncbi:HD domain-containing protein [Mycobacterium sp. SMC-18]|uniref:HD domain-containing protein n=1 Tax=Mycobacterium TaxID=1763 RepID=UPI000CDDAE61|nr:HD domain-containing protein [Mycobacterium kansasii]POX75460.1 phosphohydrolase [Mycobacterium kansasii]POY13673.1 phosphohydrolase [Mycobacterium kansasii]
MRPNSDHGPDLGLPESTIAVAAQDFCRSVSPPFIYNHCVRSYLFARHMATANGLRAGTDYDDELVFLACLLHDLGATEHANGSQRFEVDGADAAAAFLKSHGLTDGRIATVWRAVALHTSDGISHRFGNVEAVTQMGVGVDVFGRGREAIPQAFADVVHATWPRHDLGYALAVAIVEQVERNPAKASPLNFPGHLYNLRHPAGALPDYFDLVDAAGWNDRPDRAPTST